MRRYKNAAILQRNKDLIADYTANPNQPLGELAARHGLVYPAAWLVLKDNGFEIDRTRKLSSRPISQMHFLIGRKLDAYCLKASQRDNNTTLGVSFRMSARKLAKVREGTVEPTLTELRLIAKVLGLTLTEMISDTEKVCQPQPQTNRTVTGSSAG